MAPTIMNCLRNKTHQTHAATSINQINSSLHLEHTSRRKCPEELKEIHQHVSETRITKYKNNDDHEAYEVIKLYIYAFDGMPISKDNGNSAMEVIKTP